MDVGFQKGFSSSIFEDSLEFFGPTNFFTLECRTRQSTGKKLKGFDSGKCNRWRVKYTPALTVTLSPSRLKDTFAAESPWGGWSEVPRPFFSLRRARTLVEKWPSQGFGGGGRRGPLMTILDFLLSVLPNLARKQRGGGGVGGARTTGSWGDEFLAAAFLQLPRPNLSPARARPRVQSSGI